MSDDAPRAEGYAVRLDGRIMLQTVGPHARSAKVNGLCVLFNIVPRNDWTDNYIDEIWSAAIRRLTADKLDEHSVDIIPVAVCPTDEGCRT